jgi:hypothetical protein
MHQSTDEPSVSAGRFSRSSLLKAVAAAAGMAALPSVASANGPGVSFPFFPAVNGRYSTESLATIVSNLLTFEYLTVTYLFYSLKAADQSKVPAGVLAAWQAEIAIKQYHIDFLSTLIPGTTPATTTFTVPTSLPANASQALQGVPTADQGLRIEELLGDDGGILYQTAAREFAELGQPTLVEYAFQIGAQYYEYRGIIRRDEGNLGEAEDIPPNTAAFEEDTLLYTQQLIDRFKSEGLIGGTGQALPYPGRTSIMASTGSLAARINPTRPVTP